MSEHLPLILVVEDEPRIRRFVCTALEDEGRVGEAATAAAAIEAFSGPAPALAIIDLGLPDRDGVELIRELRGWNPLPILVLSARLAEAEKVAALDAGADDYLTKPFGVLELRARVRALLRRRKVGAGETAIAVPVRPQATLTGILPIFACHSLGPVMCTELPCESTATVTGMSLTSNS